MERVKKEYEERQRKKKEKDESDKSKDKDKENDKDKDKEKAEEKGKEDGEKENEKPKSPSNETVRHLWPPCFLFSMINLVSSVTNAKNCDSSQQTTETAKEEEPRVFALHRSAPPFFTAVSSLSGHRPL